MNTARRNGVFGVALFALLAAGLVAWFRLGVLLTAQQSIGHSQQVLSELGQVGILANQTDRARRAYLDGQGPAAYRLYRDDRAQLDSTLGSVRALTGDDPVHRRIVADIVAIAEATGTNPTAPTPGAAPTERGPATADEFGRVLALLGAMHDHEAAVLDQQAQAAGASVRGTRLLIFAVLGGGALAVTALWWGTAASAARAASGAAAAGRADVERELQSLPEAMSIAGGPSSRGGSSAATDPEQPISEEEVRGALAGSG